ncbi:MAG: polar amino acid transport system substrate-binding protein [Bacillota bacterium]|jgi:polar amino acid transport system substrate-binding protein|nr:polar amino acid transport system substrate-binding protein [Bacillota bacterium]MDK2924313.1 polar amino acid transport system substrate-binding protein [Bacillota bacterium]
MNFAKKVTAALLASLMVAALLLAGCTKQEPAKPADAPAQENASEGQAADDSLARVKAAGKLVAGLDDAFPPFGFRNEKNELVGFDIDLGNELAKRLGVKMEWQPTEWSSVIMSLKSKKFDVIWSGMSITEERKKEINFSMPYIGSAQVIIVKSDNKTINGREDLAGKVVGTQLGSTGEEAAKRELKGVKELKTFDAFTEAINDLNIGRLDAVIIDDVTANYYLKTKPGAFRIVDDVLSYEPMGIGVRKEDVTLLEAINKELKAMIEDGTYAKISERWFGTDMSKHLPK